MAFPPPAELIPHRAPMLLLDEVVAWEQRVIVCRTTLRDEHPFVSEGRASSLLAIELFAQAAAALVSLLGRLRGGAGPATGALLGTRELELCAPWLRVGDDLIVRCEELWTMDDAAQIGCQLSVGSEMLARGSVNVMAGARR